jgi:hypothetical protein
MTIQHQVPDLNVTFSPHTEASEPVKRDIEIRWGLPEDEPRIVELLELNGMHGRPQRLLYVRGDSRGQRRNRADAITVPEGTYILTRAGADTALVTLKIKARPR